LSVIDAQAGTQAISSTLIAAHVEEDKLSAVADAINSLPNVSHNYLRNHYYNLWFTLKAPDSHHVRSVSEIIKDLSEKFKTDFISFPAVRRYKLDSSAVKHHSPPDNFNALFCCEAAGDILESAAKYLCGLPQVSHCYERKTLGHWPYNLYAMLHETDLARIEKIVADFVGKFDIKQFQTLPTIRSLK
jgi:DNA-binding Lrp family transcriptional regulator